MNFQIVPKAMNSLSIFDIKREVFIRMCVRSTKAICSLSFLLVSSLKLTKLNLLFALRKEIKVEQEKHKFPSENVKFLQ